MRWVSRLAPACALLAGALLLASGPGTRIGLWPFQTGFQLLRWAAWLGLAAAVLALAALAFARLRSLPRSILAAALVLGLIVTAVPAYWLASAPSAPPINDISTDMADPPAFVAVLPLRAGAPDSATYGGPGVAAIQRRLYPDIRPLILAAAPAEAFDRALAAARKMGWQIVAQDPASGRIEATATTLWFGFKDDVVIRVRAEGAGSRIDLRSKSRIGRGDFGTNARRVRAYLTRIEH